MATTAPVMPVLDPSKWETPKEEFVGVVRVSRYGNTDEQKTKDGETFTEFFNYPRAIITHKLVVERLDAVYKNKETGETSPIRRYQDLSLERYDERKRAIVAATQGDNKNTFILGEFAKVKGLKLAPDPSAIQGAVCIWVREGTHKFGGNLAKNLLYPKKLLGWMNLPEDASGPVVYPAITGALDVEGHLEFEYNGDVDPIEFDPNRGDGGSDSGGGSTSLDQAAAASDAANSGGGKAVGKAEKVAQLTEEQLIDLFVGEDPEDEDLATNIIANNKGAIPNQLKAGLVSGDLVEAWMKDDKLVVVDGVYAKP